MTSQSLTPLRRRAQADHLNLTLWTLQGWLAMFFVGAGYAKLNEPMTSLIELMVWPAYASETVVRGAGLVEIVLAVLLLAPLASWKVGRPLLLGAAGALALAEAVMLAVHVVGIDVVPALTNLLLLGLTLPVLWYRMRPTL